MSGSLIRAIVINHWFEAVTEPVHFSSNGRFGRRSRNGRSVTTYRHWQRIRGFDIFGQTVFEETVETDGLADSVLQQHGVPHGCPVTEEQPPDPRPEYANPSHTVTERWLRWLGIDCWCRLR